MLGSQPLMFIPYLLEICCCNPDGSYLGFVALKTPPKQKQQLIFRGSTLQSRSILSSVEPCGAWQQRCGRRFAWQGAFRQRLVQECVVTRFSGAQHLGTVLSMATRIKGKACQIPALLQS